MITNPHLPKFLVSLFLLYYGVSFSDTHHSSSSAQDYEIGDVVDNFTLPSAVGDSISLYDYTGDVILLHIWHSG
ncbi:MAG: hypothetical protein JSV84_05680 [Gemmatimonadota bacterium]|nr:MAG: hypothetical protein JSV84_05680 [Gemmatimonadota bacterium]